MNQNLLLFFDIIILVSSSNIFSVKIINRNYSRLVNFSCEVARDELEKHPEMRTIALIELKNNFPKKFSRDILNCLPERVSKVIMSPNDKRNNRISLPKTSMVIYVADNVEKVISNLMTFINLPVNNFF